MLSSSGGMSILRASFSSSFASICLLWVWHPVPLSSLVSSSLGLSCPLFFIVWVSDCFYQAISAFSPTFACLFDRLSGSSSTSLSLVASDYSIPSFNNGWTTSLLSSCDSVWPNDMTRPLRHSYKYSSILWQYSFLSFYLAIYQM